MLMHTSTKAEANAMQNAAVCWAEMTKETFE